MSFFERVTASPALEKLLQEQVTDSLLKMV
jgi:hypothetical protein